MNYVGEAMEGSSNGTARTWSCPWTRQQPQQMERQVIWEWLPTGLIMMDSLTPMGRGQSMLLVSSEMSEMRNITQMVSSHLERSNINITTIHADLSNTNNINHVDMVVQANGKDTEVSALLAAHTACTVGENLRDCSKGDEGHVLVLLDDLSPLRRLWERAGNMIFANRGINDDTSTMEDLTEMRHYYSPLLQRAACMSSNGTMSILASMPYEEHLKEENENVIEEFSNVPPSVRERLNLIKNRGIPLNMETLRKIGLEMYAPKSSKNNSLRHCEELKSICDGHVEVLSSKSSKNILCPAASLTRIGMATKSGKDIKDVRPGALRSLARGLRLRLVGMMEDSHPISKAESSALLEAMSQGNTHLSLVDQVILLYASTCGHFFDVQKWGSHLSGGLNSPILMHVKECAPETWKRIENTSEICETSKSELDICLRLYKATIG